MKTIEQKLRDALERMGVANAQGFSAGELVELANLVKRTPVDLGDLSPDVARLAQYISKASWATQADRFTAATLVNSLGVNHRNARRFTELARRFDGAKSSTCQNVIDALQLDGDPIEPLADIVDRALAKGGGL